MAEEGRMGDGGEQLRGGERGAQSEPPLAAYFYGAQVGEVWRKRGGVRGGSGETALFIPPSEPVHNKP